MVSVNVKKTIQALHVNALLAKTNVSMRMGYAVAKALAFAIVANVTMVSWEIIVLHSSIAAHNLSKYDKLNVFLLAYKLYHLHGCF